MRGGAFVKPRPFARVSNSRGRCPNRGHGHCRVAVGVDLGTCNSAVSLVQDGQPVALELGNGRYTMPSSVVCTEDSLEPLMGGEELNGESCVLSNAKRFLGRRSDEVKDDARRSLVPMTEGKGQFVVYCPPGVERTVSPQEVASPRACCPLDGTSVQVSSVVLKALFQVAERHAQEAVDRAVISVPTYFDERQRAATLEAASLSGVDKVALLQEPIAAALAYGFGRSEKQNLILVVDMGGGTFDVSILSSFEGIMEVVSYAGDARLGGQDFDHAIAEWLMRGLPRPRTDWENMSEARNAAEELKIQLCTKGKASCWFCGRRYDLDMATFLEITEDLSLRFLQPIQKAGQTARVDWMDQAEPTVESSPEPDPYRPPPKRITQVVLAGGSSALPSLQSLISRMTGIKNLKCPSDPKLCVALGAAVFGGMLEGQVEGIEIMDGSYSYQLHDRSTGFVF